MEPEPVIGGTYMIGLLAQWRDTLAEIWGPASVRAYLSVFSHALTVTVKEWGWLRGNPLNNVRMPHIPRRRVRYLSEEERQRLQGQLPPGLVYRCCVGPIDRCEANGASQHTLA